MQTAELGVALELLNEDATEVAQLTGRGGIVRRNGQGALAQRQEPAGRPDRGIDLITPDNLMLCAQCVRLVRLCHRRPSQDHGQFHGLQVAHEMSFGQARAGWFG